MATTQASLPATDLRPTLYPHRDPQDVLRRPSHERTRSFLKKILERSE